MASIMSHAVAASAIAAVAKPGEPLPARFWVALAITAALPDADVIGFYWGLPNGHMLGHRGITHSLPFAAVLAALLVRTLFRQARWHRRWPLLWGLFFAGIASHGVLDAMTTGGQGIAFFAPFSPARVHFPWRPILVSPIGVARFFTEYGLRVLQNEMVWIWLPSAIAVAASTLLRRRVAAAPHSNAPVETGLAGD
jgi:inner membrane protein